LIGMVAVLLSLPIIILFCFVHHRMKEEERATVAIAR
jgi:hypothetical protein